MKGPKTALLSVIIPTHHRPEYLPHAVASALESSPGSVEVVVVPNGNDVSWHASLAPWKDDPRVIVSPILEANGNAARNHGMAHASGTYIRFLDDDDYFYPEAARAQLEHLIKTGADLSFGEVAIVDATERKFRLAHHRDTTDYTETVFAPAQSSLPCASVYRRSLIDGLEWDRAIPYFQDVIWSWELCRKQEIRSVRFDGTVGAWVQHETPGRVSRGHNRGKVAKSTARYLLPAAEDLRSQGRLSNQRAAAAADHLWWALHAGCMYDPFYWIRLAPRIRSLAPKRHPNTRLYDIRLVRCIDPLLVELLIMPWRWSKNMIRMIMSLRI